MKILAIEKDVAGSQEKNFAPHLKTEAAMVWELQQAGLIREVYFRQDQSSAVLMLECTNTKEAGRILSELPLVRAGLIEFEIIPLVPYSGFARQFADGE